MTTIKRAIAYGFICRIHVLPCKSISIITAAIISQSISTVEIVHFINLVSLEIGVTPISHPSVVGCSTPEACFSQFSPMSVSQPHAPPGASHPSYSYRVPVSMFAALTTRPNQKGSFLAPLATRWKSAAFDAPKTLSKTPAVSAGLWRLSDVRKIDLWE